MRLDQRLRGRIGSPLHRLSCGKIANGTQGPRLFAFPGRPTVPERPPPLPSPDSSWITKEPMTRNTVSLGYRSCATPLQRACPDPLKRRQEIVAIVHLVAFVGGGVLAPVLHEFEEGVAYEAHRMVEQLVRGVQSHDGSPAAEKPHEHEDAHATCLLCLTSLTYASTDAGYSLQAGPFVAMIRAPYRIPVEATSLQNYGRGPPFSRSV